MVIVAELRILNKINDLMNSSNKQISDELSL